MHLTDRLNTGLVFHLRLEDLPWQSNHRRPNRGHTLLAVGWRWSHRGSDVYAVVWFRYAPLDWQAFDADAEGTLQLK